MSHDEYKHCAVNCGLRLTLSYLASKTNTAQRHSVEFKAATKREILFCEKLRTTAFFTE